MPLGSAATQKKYSVQQDTTKKAAPVDTTRLKKDLEDISKMDSSLFNREDKKMIKATKDTLNMARKGKIPAKSGKK